MSTSSPILTLNCLPSILSSRFTALLVSLLLTLTAHGQSPVAPVLTPFVPGGNGIVSGEISHQLEYTGTATRFAATGLPRGLTLNTSTGLVSGRPTTAGNYTMLFTAWNGTAKSAPLTVYWAVEPLPTGIVGTYSATLDRHPWYNGGYGGYLRLTVAADGSYTGYITRGIHRNSITGRLNAQIGGDPLGTFQVARRSPYPPLTVAFTLPVGAGSITGTLQEPQGEVIQLSGIRAGFSTSQPATAYVGRWNSAFELPEGLAGNATYPQGATWASQTISSSGVVSWTTRLADGTSNTFSTDLGAGGQTMVHLMLYSYTGSVQGSQSYLLSNDTTIGSLGWVKSVNTTRSYPSGFPLHILSGFGGRYTPPAAGQQIFGISAGSNNARLTFSQGGLSTPYNQIFSIGAANKVTVPTDSSSNPYNLRFSINFTTGVLSGTGTAMDYLQNQPTNSRSGTFSGLLIPFREQAVGHFLLPTSRVSTSPILSGSLIGQENIIDF